MKVRLSGPARRQADRLDRWWRENRPATRDLFAQELAAAQTQLAHSPERGVIYAERNGVIVRRILLPKTENHIYLEIDRSSGVVMIIALWGAKKGKGPRL